MKAITVGEAEGVHIELGWPRPFADPVPCRGFLGLWTVDADTAPAVELQMAQAVAR